MIEKDSPTKVPWNVAEKGFCIYQATMQERAAICAWLQKHERRKGELSWAINGIIDEDHLSE